MNTFRVLPFLAGLGVSLLILTACEGQGIPTGVSLPGQRPLPTRPAQAAQAPGKVQVITLDPTIKPLTQITPTLQVTARVTGTLNPYDAAKIISTFGAQMLGVGVSVPRSTGLSGAIILPQAAKGSVNTAASLAGEVVAGTVTTDKGLNGVAQIALGKGKVSGDMNLDITSASLGAFSFLSKAAPPTSGPQALTLIRQTFPALVPVLLSESGSSGGMYIFEASLTKQGPDWKSRQSTMLATRIVAGAGKIGIDTIVWAVVANGELATIR